MVLDWFFTQNPKTVIETIASQELKVDSNLKATIIKEMENYKDDEISLNIPRMRKESSLWKQLICSIMKNQEDKIMPRGCMKSPLKRSAKKCSELERIL